MLAQREWHRKGYVMIRKMMLVGALLGAAFSAGCVTQNGTTDEGWKQISQGVGQVIGQTKADAQVAAASEKVAKYCGTLQAVAVGATIFSPEKVRSAALKAEAVVSTVCASPPTDVASALRVLADAYVSARNAGAVPATAPPPPAGATTAPTV